MDKPRGLAGAKDARKPSIRSGVALARKSRHSAEFRTLFVIGRIHRRLRAVKPFRSARLQQEHQQSVRVAGDPANNIPLKKAILANPLDGASKGLHLQPVSRLLKRVCLGSGEARSRWRHS